MAKHHGLYDESPSIKHDDEGHTKVHRPEKHVATSEEKGVKEENFPIHVKHALERQSMHAKHELDHGIHDAAKAGDKSELHDRHQKDMKEMHSKHSKETGAHGGEMAGKGGATGEPIEKIERGAK